METVSKFRKGVARLILAILVPIIRIVIGAALIGIGLYKDWGYLSPRLRAGIEDYTAIRRRRSL